jgi:hypothetical protein
MAGDVLGIDIGSATIGIVQVAPDGSEIKRAYGYHHGRVREVFGSLLDGFPLGDVRYTPRLNPAPKA